MPGFNQQSDREKAMSIWASMVWIGLAFGYLFLAGAVTKLEIIASVLFASLGTALAIGTSWNADRRFAGPIITRAFTQPLAKLLPETLTVGRELILAISRRYDQRSAFVRQPFDPGSKDDPSAAGRRAVLILGISLAPRTFVVRGESSDLLLLHSLPKKPVSCDRRWPM